MAEIQQPNSDTDLERRLRTLGRQITFPPTPPLAQSVRQRLAAPPASRSVFRRPAARRFVFALAALVAASVVVLIAVPGARTALAGRLGLPGIEIRQVPSSPRLPVTATPLPATSTAVPGAAPAMTATAEPTVAPTATVQPLGDRLHLGQPVALSAAQQQVSFPILLPAQLGPPDAVYVASASPGGEVTLVYPPRAGLPVTTETGVGLLLGEFQGRTDQVFISKMAGPGTTIVPVTVAGQPGFWLSGQPHEFLYQDAGGVAHQQTLRLADNTLIWTHGTVTLRIESALSEDEAVRIATTVR